MNKDTQKVWEKHKDFIELLAKVNNSSVFVAEYKANYLYLSDNFHIFGYESEVIHSLEADPEYIESRIHPEDAVILRMMQDKLFDFICSFPLEHRKDYKHIYEFRIRNAAGIYNRYIMQQQILELHEDGNPWLLCGIIDISPHTSSSEQIKLRVINYKTGEIVPFSTVEQAMEVKLSKREKEVLEMARKGMLTKEISDKLSLSVHTVNKHRQNIMQKMNADNVLEAIDYAQRLGLLD